MKKNLTLLLVLTLSVCLLSACNSSNHEKESSGDTPPSSLTNEEEASNQKNTEFSFPLAEKEELSIWCAWSSSYLDDPNEMVSIQAMEEATNIHISYTVVGDAEASEKYGLLLASGDYPDITMGGQANYPGGMEKAVSDGIYLDLTDYVNTIMPNYKALLDADDSLKHDCITDHHRYLQIYSLNGNDDGLAKERPYIGLVVRQDWLDDLGLSSPVTIEDWHSVLTAFKQEKGATAPLMLGTDGFNNENSFLTAYGVLKEWYVEDGKVCFGPVTDGYKRYLELMNEWYQEGLIDPDFTINDASGVMPLDYIAGGKAGAGSFLCAFVGDHMKTGFGMADDENYYLSPVDQPVLNAGDKSYSAFTTAKIGVASAVTSNCKNPELACRWMDFLYTDEGERIRNYGKEGVSYYLDEYGEPQWSDFVMNHPDGYSSIDAAGLVASANVNGGRYNWEAVDKYNGSNVGAASEAKAIWDIADTSKVYPSYASMTEEEGNLYSSRYVSIKTLVDEMTVKFITGAESLDNFDHFVESLYTYSLQECMDIKQAAYERYMNRTN